MEKIINPSFKKINKNTIVSIQVRDKKRVENLSYQTYKKYWLFTRKEGFTGRYDHTVYSPAEIVNGDYYGYRLQIVDNIAYHKPMVLITMVKGHVELYFDTYEEAIAYSQREEYTGFSEPFVKSHNINY